MPYKYKDKTCVICGASFTPQSGIAKTCSPACQVKNRTATQSKWHKDHPEQTAESRRRSQPKRDEWLRNNKDRMTATARAWRARNADSWSEYMQQWRGANRERARAYDSARRARQRLSPKDRAITVEYRKAIKRDPCFYCGKRMAGMHDDHFFPLALGGTDHWWNLVRACARCNTSKRARCGTWFTLKMGY